MLAGSFFALDGDSTNLDSWPGRADQLAGTAEVAQVSVMGMHVRCATAGQRPNPAES